MKISVLDKTGKQVETLELNDTVFGIKPNTTVLAQYLRVYLHNKRQGTSATKTRGDVSGGGKKPWRQKGTGRARVGSIRSPLWRHGGIIHGPQPKSWTLSLSKNIKKLAITSILSKKTASDSIIVLDKLKLELPKTKQLLKILEGIKGNSRKTLLVLLDNDLNIRKSASNLSNVSTALVDNLNAYEIMHSEKIVFLKDAVLKINEKYSK